jgi:hypothetical protein
LRNKLGITLREYGSLDNAVLKSKVNQRGNNPSILSGFLEFLGKSPCHHHSPHRPCFNVFISLAEQGPMKGIKVHLRPGAKGETASFGEIAIVQLDGSSFPGAQIRTEREACPAGCALTLIEDFALQSFKTSVHRGFSNSNRKNRR